MIVYFHNHKVYKTNQITTQVIDKYVLKRIKDKVKRVTINKKMVSLNAMMNHLIKKELIDKIHYKYDKLKEEEKISEYVIEKDVNKCLEYLLNNESVCNQHKLIFLLQLSTGIRRTELTDIMNDNIDLEKKTIYLTYTKSGKPRYIYLTDFIIQIGRAHV